MAIDTLSKKIKLARLGKIKDAPRWADIKKFGLKRARRRRIIIAKETNWRRTRFKI
ncbi:MAG: hypothetical protein RMJ17_02655 [Candidatus Aenigmarchaeota archaeon]|nr:hypothetical protein [Candidatus Aenigmarchaeota archaeon]MDW8149470.1 hypothetical protein [Candidatus Aenigmarchaeota archaeon]